MKRLVSLLLIALMLCNTAPFAFAQSETPEAQKEEKADSTIQQSSEVTPEAKAEAETQDALKCKSQGRSDGKKINSSGSFAGGLVGGVILGLIGTGIAVLVQSRPEPPVFKLMAVEGETCRMIYSDAYESAGKGKKQSSALLGGLVGTLVIVTILLATAE